MTAAAPCAPLAVEVRRGNLTESRHLVHMAIAAPDGTVRHVWGDADREIYPRSAIKPLQALPLIETGAAAAFDVSDEELALACGSHAGSTGHLMVLDAWMARLGITEDALACGPHVPFDARAAERLLKSGEPPDNRHNNCSGKHMGFLTTALHMDEPLDGYLAPDHPVQARIYGALETLAGEPLQATARGTDGCGVPVYGMSLRGLAAAMARMSAPEEAELESGQTMAVNRIVRCLAKHNFMVGGAGRFDTVAMNAGRGLYMTKSGAEGVHAAILPSLGLGIALKAEDGAKRASDTAMAHLLRALGLLDERAELALADFLAPVMCNAAGEVVGEVRVQVDPLF